MRLRALWRTARVLPRSWLLSGSVSPHSPHARPVRIRVSCSTIASRLVKGDPISSGLGQETLGPTRAPQAARHMERRIRGHASYAGTCRTIYSIILYIYAMHCNAYVFLELLAPQKVCSRLSRSSVLAYARQPYDTSLSPHDCGGFDPHSTWWSHNNDGYL